jgi:hypothetical protein
MAAKRRYFSSLARRSVNLGELQKKIGITKISETMLFQVKTQRQFAGHEIVPSTRRISTGSGKLTI